MPKIEEQDFIKEQPIGEPIIERASHLSAISSDLGKFTSGIITGGIIQTGLSGQRIAISGPDNDITFYSPTEKEGVLSPIHEADYEGLKFTGKAFVLQEDTPGFALDTTAAAYFSHFAINKAGSNYWTVIGSLVPNGGGAGIGLLRLNMTRITPLTNNATSLGSRTNRFSDIFYSGDIKGYYFTFGDTSTRWDITDQGGNTWRYTWDGTGTDPDVDGHIASGDEVVIYGFVETANNGGFQTTAVGTDYFEVTNANGVAEADETNIRIDVKQFDISPYDGGLMMNTTPPGSDILLNPKDKLGIYSSDSLIGYFDSNGLIMNSKKITGLATPTASTDAVTKDFAEGLLSELVYPSDTLQESDDAEVEKDSPTYVKAKEIEVNVTGKIKTKFDLKQTSGPNNTIAGKIFVNGAAVGTEHTSTLSTYATKTDESIDVATGDLVQVYVKSVDSNQKQKVENFRLYWDVSTKGYIDNADELFKGLEASDNLKASADTERQDFTTTYVKKKEIQVYRSGVIRIKFKVRGENDTYEGRGMIYVNGAAVGIQRAESGNTYVEYSEDITVEMMDLVQLYARVSTDEGAGGLEGVKDFRLYWDIAPVDDYKVETN